jgi:hypothetical protein
VLGHRRVEKDDYVRWHRILHAHGWGAPPGRRNGAARAGTRCSA